MRRLVFNAWVVFGVVAVALLLAPAAGATCGSASCFLVTGTREGVQEKGRITIDLSYQYVNQSRMLDGSHGTDEVLTPKVDFETGELEPNHHREIRTQNTLVDLDIMWGLSERFTFVTSLPLLVDRSHEHYDDVGTPTEFFTKEDGTSGFGDIRIGGRYAFMTRARDLLLGGLAVKLPTGPYKLSDSEGAINEPTIQPGSGSTDVILSVDYSHQWLPDRLEYFASGSHKLNTTNDLEYRIGDETQLNTGLRFQTNNRVTLSIQVNGRTTTRDEFHGEAVPSTGSTLVNLTPGITLRTQETTRVYAFVQIPVVEHVNEVQLAPRASVLVGVSRTF